MRTGDVDVGAANPGMRKVQYRRTWFAECDSISLEDNATVIDHSRLMNAATRTLKV